LHEKIVELRSRIGSLEADLKVLIPTLCSTCEFHATRNLELAQCVDQLQDENCKLSCQEPQLGVLIASYKHFDGWALGSDKFGESGGEREGKFGNVPVPPQPTRKDKFASKPKQLREKLSEKASEKPSEKPSGKPSEKPCEEAHPKPKPRPIRFHCEICGKDAHKREFCYKRKREAGMAKEWANKDRYHPSHGVLEPRMALCVRFRHGEMRDLIAEVVVWRGRSDQPSEAVRPALPRFLGSSVSEVVMLVVSVPFVMV
jgi:hypothetical protein